MCASERTRTWPSASPEGSVPHVAGGGSSCLESSELAKARTLSPLAPSRARARADTRRRVRARLHAPDVVAVRWSPHSPPASRHSLAPARYPNRVCQHIRPCTVPVPPGPLQGGDAAGECRLRRGSWYASCRRLPLALLVLLAGGQRQALLVAACWPMRRRRWLATAGLGSGLPPPEAAHGIAARRSSRLSPGWARRHGPRLRSRTDPTSERVREQLK